MGFSLISLVFFLLSFLPLCLHFLLEKKKKGNHGRFFKKLINFFIFMAVLGFSCSTTNLHCSTWSLYLCVLRLSCLAACGILVPRPGIRTAPPALEAWCRNH